MKRFPRSAVLLALSGLLLGGGRARPDEANPAAGSGEERVEIRGVDERAFPEITLDFEVRRPDGTALLDARKEDFQVSEYGKPVEILSFQAPQTTEVRPTTVVLVLDSSGSMREEDRLGALKEAVSSFLESMPAGSRVAVFVFSSDVRQLCEFTADAGRIRREVRAIEADGPTRFYDAVAAALEQIADQSGRRAVLAMTDGMDTASREYDLERVVTLARRLGVPVHAVAVGTESEIASDELRDLALGTRGQYFPVRETDQLRSIYEELARRLKDSYALTYRTDRRLPDGTLRPVAMSYRESRQVAHAQVYVRGMIVPAGGWSRLFLLLVAVLTALLVLTGRRSGRSAAGPPLVPPPGP